MGIKTSILILICLILGCSKEERVYQVTQGYKSNELLLELHNQERSNGLALSDSLNHLAEVHAVRMASKGRLKHQDMSILHSDGWMYAGENIAKNQKDEYEVFESWMNSRGHRQNIQNINFTHVGFGMSINEKNEIYWCACFGRR